MQYTEGSNGGSVKFRKGRMSNRGYQTPLPITTCGTAPILSSHLFISRTYKFSIDVILYRKNYWARWKVYLSNFLDTTKSLKALFEMNQFFNNDSKVLQKWGSPLCLSSTFAPSFPCFWANCNCPLLNG